MRPFFAVIFFFIGGRQDSDELEEVDEVEDDVDGFFFLSVLFTFFFAPLPPMCLFSFFFALTPTRFFGSSFRAVMILTVPLMRLILGPLDEVAPLDEAAPFEGPGSARPSSSSDPKDDMAFTDVDARKNCTYKFVHSKWCVNQSCVCALQISQTRTWMDEALQVGGLAQHGQPPGSDGPTSLSRRLYA